MKNALSFILLTLAFILLSSEVKCNNNGNGSSPSNSESYLMSNSMMLLGETPASPPVPSVTNYCGSSALTRSAPPSGVTYYWQGTNSNGTSTSNSNISFIVTSDGTYYIRAYDPTANPAWSLTSTAVSVNVKEVPQVQNLTNDTRCGTGTITISSSSSVSRAYVKILEGSTLKVSTENSATYTTTISSSKTYTTYAVKDGCQGSTYNLSATIKPLPQTPTGSSTNICSENPSPVTLLAYTGTTGASLKWYQEGTSTLVNTGSGYTVTSTGGYDVKAYKDGCYSGLHQITATINTKPAALAVGGDNYRCGTGELLLQATTSTSGVTYDWYLNSQSMQSGTEAWFGVQLSPGEQKTAMVKAYKESEACFATQSKQVNGYLPVPSAPVISNGDNWACGNTLKTFNESGISPGYSVRWLLNGSNEQTGNEVSYVLPNATNTITLEAYDHGCSTSNNKTVPKYAPPPAPGVSNVSRIGPGPVTLSPVTVPETTLEWYINGNTLERETEGYLDYYTYTYSTKNYTIKRWDHDKHCSSAGTATVTIVPAQLEIQSLDNPDKIYLAQNTIEVGGETYTNFDLAPNMGTVQFRVASNTSWTTSGMPDWVTTDAGGPPNSDVVVTIATNFNSSGPRQDYFNLHVANLTERIYLTQQSCQLEGIPISDSYLTTNTISMGNEVTQYVLGERSGDFQVQVLADVPFDVEVNSEENWLELNTIETGGETIAHFGYSENNRGSQKATIELKYNDAVAQTIYVYQRSVPFMGSTSPLNKVSATIYKEGGGILSQSVQYYDKLGKPTQSLSRNVEYNKVLVSETDYDEFGRAVGTTLPIPLSRSNLNYIDDFINRGTLKYGSEISGTLLAGQYYTNDNDGEPYVPADGYPYARVEYSETKPGAVRKSFMPGEKFHNSHSMRSYAVNAPAQELLNHPLNNKGINLFTLKQTSVTPDVTTRYEGMIKSVSIDPEDKESIVYYDAEGRVIASCMSSSEAGAVSMQVTATIHTGTEGGYLDIHIPSSASPGITQVGTWNYEVVDLSNDNVVTGPLSSVGPGVYRVVCPDNAGDVSFRYYIKYKYYSFSAYDEAGRLVRALSPRDVEDITATGGSAGWIDTRCSKNTYNVSGWLLESESVDEGRTTYKYSRDGKIRFSQNAQQAEDGTFSFTNYDTDGRVVVAGECYNYLGYLAYANVDPYLDYRYEQGEFDIMKLITAASGTYPAYEAYRDLTFTYYDTDYSSEIIVTDLVQKYLRGRVSKTMNKNTTTWYGYTYDGLIDWTVQRLNGFNAVGDASDDLFVIKYAYDFNRKVTSTTNYLVDQDGEKYNEFTHRYAYDFNHNLKAVYTQPGSGPETLHARYEYYQHGPLKRVELADGLQGIDYVYTLQGMLKSINHPSLNSNDPGKDGYTGAHQSFAQDVFGMSLDYHDGDYIRPGTGITGNPVDNRYDGNITMQRWRQKAIDITTVGEDDYLAAGIHNAYAYYYTERNFLARARFGAYTASSGNFDDDDPYTMGSPTGPFYNVVYDANGNIQRLHRNGKDVTGFPLSMDNLTYRYDPVRPNRLIHVSESSVAGNYPEDIDDQGTFDVNDNGTWNYSYNSIGQITGNAADGHYFEYDVYGKVTGIYNNAGHTDLKVRYVYDDRGFRVCKVDDDLDITTWYIRDLSGNILSTWLETTGNPELDEVPLYGANRLGMARFTGGSLQKYVYELGDHLGNVRATVAWDDVNPGQLEILSATDYYPFGMVMAGRNFVSENYRFGYQGQFAEKDEETGYTAFELRLYDTRIGRWMVPDPYEQYWSPYLAMGNSPVMMIDPDGGKVKWSNDLGFVKRNWGILFGFEYTGYETGFDWNSSFRPGKDVLSISELIITGTKVGKGSFWGSLLNSLKEGNYNTSGQISGRISVGVQAGFEVCKTAEAMVSLVDFTIAGGTYETFDNSNTFEGELIFRNGTEVQQTFGLKPGGGYEYNRSFNTRNPYGSIKNKHDASIGPVSFNTTIDKTTGNRTTRLSINASGRVALILGIQGGFEWGAVIHH